MVSAVLNLYKIKKNNTKNENKVYASEVAKIKKNQG